MRDMVAFIIVLVFIIIGFALIFLEFQRDDVYGVQLYSTYQVLYGNLPADVSSVSQQLFAALILFLLNVVLLNMLISIMGDSYDKVQERRVLTDSLTRLEMVLESMTYMRIFARGKVEKRGHLIFCEGDVDRQDDNGESNEWEGRINVIKRALKQNDQRTEEIKSEVNSIKEEVKSQMSSMQQMLESQQQMINSMDEKFTTTLDEVLMTIKANSKN